MRQALSLSIILFCTSLLGCKDQADHKSVSERAAPAASQEVDIKYAQGFSIEALASGYKVTITQPWPEADKTYNYFLKGREKPSQIPTGFEVIQIPIKEIILTSTTQIPPLVLLQEEKSLIGFPSTDYISSPEVRQRVDAGQVEELGSNESINVERSISLQPDLVMGFGIDANNPTYDQISRAGIPILYNGEWTESHPLGKAEWIKLFGALYGKMDEAQAIFDRIEADYKATLDLVAGLPQPKVISGASWKDIWYLPYGNSWQGKMLQDAGGDYIYAHEKGSGSLAYNIEKVLTDAQGADYWIAPGQYTSYTDLLEDQQAYGRFEAFKKRQVYTIALTKGAKGGITYYEEADMRPDIVLKDLVKILHPEIGLDHELYFFKPLKN